MNKPLISQVESAIKAHQMLVQGETVLVACSGGADSVALFHLLRELSGPLKIRLRLVHFDHGLRRGSEKDFHFVKRLAQNFKIPFYGAKRKQKRIEKGLSPEESARKSRYEFFMQTAKKTGVRKIVLAHHRDDQAETVLMRLIQGTGLRGLQGIRPVISIRGVTFIRPLITLTRWEIRDYLKRNSIKFREDPTNRSPRFLRNRIRNRLLPLIEKEFNPQICDALCRLAETAAAETTEFDNWIKNNWRKYLHSRRNEKTLFHRDRFLLLPSMLQFRLLDRVLHDIDPASGLDFHSWERIKNQLPKGRLRISLPRNLDLNLTANKLFIRKSDTMKPPK